MMIEYTHQRFDKGMVEVGVRGLDFELERRSQGYRGPGVTLPA